MNRRAPRIPKYLGTYPAHLATATELDAQGLKAGTDTPVALLEYREPGRSGTCGLFERAAAVPREREAS
ncbi:hypothetical protein [Deinococcus sp. NW-56]|uniref:hypothetical protein n=1 Tax=Deinococcus sp. NW-56 TaxID=2080419 RepID=UPI001319B8EE|nr:hypothetical protein [Deinococcus sp. NW-56]